MPFLRAAAAAAISLYGRWFRGEPMPTPRMGHVMVAVGGFIYCIGGFDGVNWLTVNEAYDPSSDTWVTKAPMPTARSAMAAAVLQGKIHVVGGYGPTGALTVHEVYDPSTDTWTTAPALPSPARFYLAAASTMNRLFVFGGYDGINISNTVHSYSPGASNWLIETNMPNGRYLAGVAVADNKLYVFAGRGLTATDLNERYDPLTRLWETMPTVPEGKQDMKAVALGGNIHVLGGQGFATAHWKYDPQRRSWEARAPLPLGRDQFGAASVGERIYVAGGYREGQYLNRLDIFVPLGGG